MLALDYIDDHNKYERVSKILATIGNDLEAADLWRKLQDLGSHTVSKHSVESSIIQPKTIGSDWQQKKQQYWEEAFTLYKQGQDYFSFLQQAVRCDLKEYEHSKVINMVEILPASDCCEKCRELNSKRISLDEALNTMPIPVKDCGQGFCRCTYIPIVE